MERMDGENSEKKKKYLWKGRMGIMEKIKRNMEGKNGWIGIIEKIKRNIDEKMDGDNGEKKKKY